MIPSLDSITINWIEAEKMKFRTLQQLPWKQFIGVEKCFPNISEDCYV